VLSDAVLSDAALSDAALSDAALSDAALGDAALSDAAALSADGVEPSRPPAQTTSSGSPSQAFQCECRTSQAISP
jgi:hypothetical protein